MEYHIICVGAGGTGGNFLKELGRFLSFFRDAGKSWKLSIIDGDTVKFDDDKIDTVLKTQPDRFCKNADGIRELFAACGADPAKGKVKTSTIRNLEDKNGYYVVGVRRIFN